MSPIFQIFISNTEKISRFARFSFIDWPVIVGLEKVLFEVDLSPFYLKHVTVGIALRAALVFVVGRGLGGLGNAAKRNAKTDQLRPVPRDKGK